MWVQAIADPNKKMFSQNGFDFFPVSVLHEDGFWLNGILQRERDDDWKLMKVSMKNGELFRLKKEMAEEIENYILEKSSLRLQFLLS